MAEATTARERPLTLRAAEVRAVLDGRKTQVRVVARIAENGAVCLKDRYAAFARDGIGLVWRPCAGASERPMPPEKVSEYSPFGPVGSRLWVRETAELSSICGYNVPGATMELSYAAGGRRHFDRDVCGTPYANGGNLFARAISPIGMPRWASRLTLEIAEVRVERLNAISEADAVAEGVDAVTMADVPRQAAWSRRDDFRQLWDSTNGKKPGRSWADSPWVWAITFRRVETC
jgi:hypothetical protein